MTMERVDPAQLQALCELAQLRKDRDLSELARQRAEVAAIEAELAALDAAVARAGAGAAEQPDPVSLGALDDYQRLMRARRSTLNLALAHARVKSSEAQQQAIRSTGQVEVLEQMQGLRAEELRLKLARRDLG